MHTQSQIQSGSLTGGILLIAGCCIGAGMLGIPVMSALGGFIPSVILFFICWLFMVSTGLLLLEVNLWFKGDVSIITMANKTLGISGKAIGWIGFLFLFYTLMVAYIQGTGELLVDFLEQFTGIKLPSSSGSLFASSLFGIMVYLGTYAVDLFNRVLMVGLIASYTLLIFLGSFHVSPQYLNYVDWSSSFLVIPAMILSFGFHNLIPTLTTYLGGDVKKLVLTVFVGSAIPLVIYLLWEWLIIGLVPVEVFKEAYGQGDMATRALRNVVKSPWVVDLAHYFAFFAVVTSFLGVALSFVDFLADGLHVKKTASGKFGLCLLVIVVPLIFALAYPKIFLIALSYAGSFGAVILFGILPAAMVWAGRYFKKIQGVQLLPGGKIALALVIATSLVVIALQIIQDVWKGL